MIFRKTVTVALCTIISCLLLVSCAGKQPGTDDLENTNGSDTAGSDINFESAYKKYSPTDVMFKSSGDKYTASWDLAYYFLCLAIEEVGRTAGTYPDLSDKSGTGYSDQIMTRAKESILTCLAIEHAADAAGAEITDEDRASIALNQELAEEQLGGADAFREYLASNHASYEVYLYLQSIDCLYENTILEVYGEGAEKFSDADTKAFLSGEEYFTVKQIFFSAYDTDGTTKLGDDVMVSKRSTAETVSSMLDSFTGGDFDAYFDGLMFEYSEDTTALNMYPDGYLFQSGQAYEALEEAARSLEIGDVSALLETELGYHIVYRLPVNYDIVPQGYTWDSKSTLRSQAARETFGQYVEDLRIELSETASGDFFNIDLAELFK